MSSISTYWWTVDAFSSGVSATSFQTALIPAVLFADAGVTNAAPAGQRLKPGPSATVLSLSRGPVSAAPLEATPPPLARRPLLTVRRVTVTTS